MRDANRPGVVTAPDGLRYWAVTPKSDGPAPPNALSSPTCAVAAATAEAAEAAFRKLFPLSTGPVDVKPVG